MEKDPLFFLHFPRTAGTTVDDIFFANIPGEKILKIYSNAEYAKYREIEEGEFGKFEYITGHLLLTNTNPTQFYGKNVRAFTFLRDPVKRLYSEYVFLKAWKNQHLYEYLNSRNISFGQYLTSGEKLLKFRGKNFMTRCISGDSLEDSNLSESLAKAKSNLENSFMFFGIQDRFMESMLMLSGMAGLKNILHQKRNALKKSHDLPEMTREDAEIAAECNSADIELYKFALDLFDTRVRAGGEAFQKSLKNYIFLNSKFQNISRLLYQSVHQGEDSEKIDLSKDVKW